MRNLNLSNVRDTSKLTAGGYVMKVADVTDVESKEYLKVELDIAEGPYKGYYQNLFSNYGFWGLTLYMSYRTDKAKEMFKGHIQAFKASNPSFVWQDDAENDENTLKGCIIGVVLGEEEYNANDGSIKKTLKVYKTMPADEIRRGNYTIPKCKKLESRNASNEVVDTTAAFVPVSDDDMPF